MFNDDGTPRFLICVNPVGPKKMRKIIGRKKKKETEENTSSIPFIETKLSIREKKCSASRDKTNKTVTTNHGPVTATKLTSGIGRQMQQPASNKYKKTN